MSLLRAEISLCFGKLQPLTVCVQHPLGFAVSRWAAHGSAGQQHHKHLQKVNAKKQWQEPGTTELRTRERLPEHTLSHTSSLLHVFCLPLCLAVFSGK